MPIFFLQIRQMKLVVPFVSVQWPNFQEEVEAAKQSKAKNLYVLHEMMRDHSKVNIFGENNFKYILLEFCMYLNMNCQMLFKHVRIAQTHT